MSEDKDMRRLRHALQRNDEEVARMKAGGDPEAACYARLFEKTFPQMMEWANAELAQGTEVELMIRAQAALASDFLVGTAIIAPSNEVFLKHLLEAALNFPRLLLNSLNAHERATADAAKEAPSVN